MHELSIAQSIVEIATRHAAEYPVEGSVTAKVTKVELKLGWLRQVVPSALTFSFELVASGTPVEGAELEIQSIPAVGVCRRCGAESQLAAFPLQCGQCSEFDLQIIAGEELVVESLEIAETDEAPEIESQLVIQK